jgi:predicted AAA+ superfamily ATPase
VKFQRGIVVIGKTIAHYLDLMVDLLLVRRLPPHLPNAGKRLVRSPKVYVRDSGLLHALLVYPGQERYRIHSSIEAIGVAEACEQARLAGAG